MSLARLGEGQAVRGEGRAVGMWPEERWNRLARRAGKVPLTISRAEHRLSEQTDRARERSRPLAGVRSRFLPGTAAPCPAARGGASAPSSEEPRLRCGGAGRAGAAAGGPGHGSLRPGGGRSS